jgi:hypothetical protein
MSALTVSLITSSIIVLVSTWAVLTHKVKTNSLAILGLGLMNIGAAVGVAEILGGVTHVSMSSLILRTGVALLSVLYFLRVECYPLICGFIRRIKCESN